MDGELGIIESGLITALIMIIVFSLLMAVGGDLNQLLNQLQQIISV